MTCLLKVLSFFAEQVHRGGEQGAAEHRGAHLEGRDPSAEAQQQPVRWQEPYDVCAWAAKS